MRDTVTAPGLSGEASGCGGVVDTTGGGRGAQWARNGRAAGPADPAGFQFRARSPLFRSPLVDAALVEQFADVFPCLLGSSPVFVALDWGVRVEAVERRLAIDEIVVCRPEFRLERADEPLHLFCSYAGPSAFPPR